MLQAATPVPSTPDLLYGTRAGEEGRGFSGESQPWIFGSQSQDSIPGQIPEQLPNSSTPDIPQK